jgi:hypothetical protein
MLGLIGTLIAWRSRLIHVSEAKRALPQLKSAGLKCVEGGQAIIPLCLYRQPLIAFSARRELTFISAARF